MLETRDAADPEWLSFVESQPEATAFHHPVWSNVLAITYGLRPFVLVERGADGQMAAGLPLLEIHRAFAPRRFVSLPFTDYCPPLARDAASLAHLTESLVEWRQRMGNPRIEIRGPMAAGPQFQPVTVAVRHTLELEASSANVFRRLKPPVQRRIRKAERERLVVRISAARADLVPFYRLHWQTRRRLGVPVQPRRFFDVLWSTVIEPGFGFLAMAYFGEVPIAADLCLAWNGNLIGKFNASDPAYWNLSPNNLVVWAAIEWGCVHGYRSFDFGKSELAHQSLRDFKGRWGTAELPVIYSYLPRVSPSGNGLSTRALGAVIRHSPPIVCRALGEILYGRVA